MKKTIAYGFLAAVMAFGMSAFSQTYGSQQATTEPGMQGHHDGGMMDPDKRLNNLSQQLNLTDDEKAKIKPMLVDEQKQMQALHSDTSMSQQDRRSKAISIHQSTDSQIRSALTPEQQTKFDQMREQQKEKAKQMKEQHEQQSTAPPQ